MNRCLPLLIALLLLPTSAPAQLAPEESMKKFTVADGLQIELFAAEPMLINPTSIDVDHKGRVWVAEAVNYRRKNFGRPILRKEGDRIQVLIDETGEGKATKAVTFYQGEELYGPLGVCVAPYADGKGQRVFVCQSPDILVFEDKDGDLIADGPPKKFLTGFGGFDHDHGVHGINIGPDGKLYFTVGDQGVKNLQSTDGKGPKFNSNNTDCRAGTVWRCDMDGTNLELIAHNFRNNYECCVNSFGEIWLSDNDDDGNQQTRICFVMPGGNYGYHPRGAGQSHWHEEQPGIVHKALRTGFGSPTGICFYEGNLLPKKYQGELLHCDAGPREFRAFIRKPKGAGYELEKEVLVTSTDNWFRLSDCCVAPDGSVMLADWYDPGVGGHGMGDWTRGRIYRVTPKGHKGYKVPEVKVDTVEEIAKALESPCLATRSLVGEAIRQRSEDDFRKDYLGGSPATGPAPGLGKLTRLLIGDYKPELRQPTEIELTAFSRSILLYNSAPQNKLILAKMEPIEQFQFSMAGSVMGTILAMYDRGDVTENTSRRSTDRLISTLGPGFKELRRRGVTLAQVLADFHPDTPVKRPVNPAVEIAELRDGKSPFPTRLAIPICREILLALRHEDAKPVSLCFYPLAQLYDGQDIFYRAALNIACGTDPERRDKILADFDKHFPEWNDKVADLVWELRPKSVLPRLSKLLADPKLTVAQKARIVEILAASDDIAAGHTMLGLLKADLPAEVKAKALEQIQTSVVTKWKGLQASKELAASIDDLLAGAATKIHGLQLIGAANAVDRLSAVAAIAADEKGASDLRMEAVRTLGKLKSPKALGVIEGLLQPGIYANQALATEVLNALAAQIGAPPKKGVVDLSAQKALTDLSEFTLNASVPLPLRKAAVEALSGSQQGTQWLLDTHQKKTLTADLVADTGRLLRNTPYQGIRNKALTLFPAPGKLDPKSLPSPASLAKLVGNPDKGKLLLAASLKGETQCLKCHTVRGIGGSIGPDLSMIGKKASKENLFESILQPSKAIADQYLQWQIENTAGQKILGLIVEETPNSVTIRDANGKDTKIAKGDIESRTKSLVSIMPEDLIKTLTEDEFIDLVAYLFTLKTPSLTPESWYIAGPFETGDKSLDTVYEPENAKAFDPNAVFKGKGSEVKWKTVRNKDGFVDLQAHYAPDSTENISYLYQQIESPVDQEATIYLGTTEAFKLWVNNEKLFEKRKLASPAPQNDTVTVKLKKGINSVVLKTLNGAPQSGFSFSVGSEQELKVAPVK